MSHLRIVCFGGEHSPENTITKEITLNDCVFEGEGTLFGFGLKVQKCLIFVN